MADASRNITIKVLLDEAKARMGLKQMGDDAEQTGNRWQKMGGLAKAGIAVAGAAVVSFLKDATQAAIEDERAQKDLALALENTVGATDAQIESAEKFIDTTARATGVADDQLRPALETLTRATGDLDQAQKDLNVALDISAATGKPLATVVEAMGKAAMGSAGGMQRLGLRTKDAEGNMLSYEEILKEATRTMGGAAAEAAETAAGKMARLDVAVDEAKESIGAAFIPILLEAAPAVEDLALSLGELSGAVTATDSAITEWEQKTGKAVETAEDWLTALSDDVNIGKFREWLGQVPTMTDEFTNKILDGIDAWSMGTTELVALKDELKALYDQGLISKDQLDILNGAIGKELTHATEDARTHGIEPLTDAQKGLEDGVRGVIDANKDYLTSLQEVLDSQKAATDPVFAFADATRELADAQTAATAAAEEYGEGSPQHIEALGKVRDAALDVKDAEIAMGDQAAITAEEMKTHLRSLGTFTEDQINLIIADMERINAFRFQAKIIKITHEVTGGGIQARQHGGPVTTGTPYVVGEKGPEVFVPSTSGRIHPNGRSRGMGAGMTANITINAGMGSDPNSISRAVVEALQRYERTNGAIPVRTRPA